MNKPLLDERELARYSERLGNLTQETTPLWGVMNSTEMVRHMRRAIEMSLEEVTVVDRSNFLTRTVGKWIFFDLMSKWPKGLPNGKKEVWHPVPEGDFVTERESLIATLQKFVVTAAKEPSRRTVSEGFGLTSLAKWRLIHGRHLEHHFKQFGI